MQKIFILLTKSDNLSRRDDNKSDHIFCKYLFFKEIQPFRIEKSKIYMKFEMMCVFKCLYDRILWIF